MDYQPKPLDTSEIHLPGELDELLEKLAQNTHEVWAAQRLRDGWQFGPERDDSRRLHPCLIPYDELPEEEKEYDRHTSQEALKAILAAGFTIERKTD
ncbi:MAG: RyR domain-containing protein [Thiolinea sp.]